MSEKKEPITSPTSRAPKSAIKVAVAGPPHSGKSVFIGGLVKNLPGHAYVFRACPDGEGHWTYRNKRTSSLRRKGRFTTEIVRWYAGALRRVPARLTLVDIGGRRSPENAIILKEGGVTHAILLAGDPSELPKWREFMEGLGVEVIAEIHSDYLGKEDNIASSPLVVHHLERGEDVSDRPTIKKVAAILLDLLGEEEETEEEFLTPSGEGEYLLSIPALAKALGKEEVERTLPNGRVIRQVVWEGGDLIEVAKLLHHITIPATATVKVDGRAPAWLVAALVHELHPAAVAVNSPDGFVPVGCQLPDSGGRGIEFRVAELSGGWTLVEFLLDPSVPLNPAALEEIAPPDLGMGHKIVVSGRGPNWLTASLAMAYHGQAKAVACYQPGLGATTVWTHSTEVKLGSVHTFEELP